MLGEPSMGQFFVQYAAQPLLLRRLTSRGRRAQVAGGGPGTQVSAEPRSYGCGPQTAGTLTTPTASIRLLGSARIQQPVVRAFFDASGFRLGECGIGIGRLLPPQPKPIGSHNAQKISHKNRRNRRGITLSSPVVGSHSRTGRRPDPVRNGDNRRKCRFHDRVRDARGCHLARRSRADRHIHRHEPRSRYSKPHRSDRRDGRSHRDGLGSAHRLPDRRLHRGDHHSPDPGRDSCERYQDGNGNGDAGEHRGQPGRLPGRDRAAALHG